MRKCTHKNHKKGAERDCYHCEQWYNTIQAGAHVDRIVARKAIAERERKAIAERERKAIAERERKERKDAM